MHRVLGPVSRHSGRFLVPHLASTPASQQPAIPYVPFNVPKIVEIPPSSNTIGGGIVPMYLPTIEKPVKVYSFPTPDKVVIEAPTILSLLIERVEPTKPMAPMVDPTSSKIVPLIAGPRMLTIRRKKMKKHKRRKRFDRDYFKYQKYHRQKKLKAEKVFRVRMNEMMKTLESFDPMEHVQDTIKRAQRQWSTDLTPSGKKKYPHWSELMALEELYDVPKDDYIDKRAGLPSEEDAQKIAHLRKQYELKYSRNAVKVEGGSDDS